MAEKSRCEKQVFDRDTKYYNHALTVTALFHSRSSAESVVEVADHLHQVSSHFVPKHANLNIVGDVNHTI